MNELMNRLTSKTPKFWVKVRNTAIVVTAVSGAILTLPISLPATAVAILTNVALVSGTIAGTSQMTKSDNFEGHEEATN
jgi:hypothetical protein